LLLLLQPFSGNERIHDGNKIALIQENACYLPVQSVKASSATERNVRR
jgi:hypothetical protein